MRTYLHALAIAACVSLGCSNIEPLQLNPAPGDSGAPVVRKDLRSFDHGPFDRLLRRFVRTSNLVDYAGFGEQDRAELHGYLETLASVAPESLADEAARKAYWINAYNAITLAGILHFYPVDSIRDLGGFWDRVLTNCGGRNVSLNDIEHRILRPLGDPRIHVAINCASMGCPPLRDRAYSGANLDAELDDASHEFLADSQRNQFDDEQERARLSKIFSWFGGDFDVKPYGGVRGFVRTFAPPGHAWLAGEFSYGHLDYDWSLNEAAR